MIKRISLFLLSAALLAPTLGFAVPHLFVGQNGRKGLADGKKMVAKDFTILGGFTKVRGLKPFDPTYAGGMRVAVGDVTGDGLPDLVVAPGPGEDPVIQFFGTDKNNPPAGLPEQLFAFESIYKGGIFVALGDVNGDGRNDIVTGLGSDTPQVKVFDGVTFTEILSFFPFDLSFEGGVRVAAGDLDGDGRAEIIVGMGTGGTPEVRVYDYTATLLPDPVGSFLAYDETFTGGVNVATGDYDGDSKADIITAPAKGTGEVRVYSGLNVDLLHNFFPYATGYRGGVSIAAGDVNSDGFLDIFTSPLKGRNPIKRWNGATGLAVDTLRPFGADYRGGAWVALF